MIKLKNHGEDFGIKATGLSIDFNRVIKRSREISDRISKNVELLIKKNKVDRIRGFGKLTSNKTIEISDEKGKVMIRLKRIKLLLQQVPVRETFQQFRLIKKI